MRMRPDMSPAASTESSAEKATHCGVAVGTGGPACEDAGRAIRRSVRDQVVRRTAGHWTTFWSPNRGSRSMEGRNARGGLHNGGQLRCAPRVATCDCTARLAGWTCTDTEGHRATSGAQARRYGRTVYGLVCVRLSGWWTSVPVRHTNSECLSTVAHREPVALSARGPVVRVLMAVPLNCGRSDQDNGRCEQASE